MDLGRPLRLAPLLFLVACQDSEPITWVDPSVAPSVVVGAPSLEISRVRPDEALLLQLESVSPGFGGFYFDQQTGEVVVRSTVVDFPSRAALRESVSLRLADIQHTLKDRPTRFELAAFSFSELARFRDLAGAALFGADLGVNAVDADEMHNTLTIGVEPGTAQGPILAKLTRVGVPVGAVRFIDFSGYEPLVGPTSLATPAPAPVTRTVDMMGGMRIRYPGYSCTMGLFTESGGTPVGITNSHCSTLEFWEGGDFTKYRTATFDTLGYESNDRSHHFVCNVTFNCRHSDANLISQGPYTTVTWHQHQIAWRPNLNTVQAVDNAFYNTIDPTSPRVVAAVNPASQGEVVYKSGYRTGRTKGFVTQTCIDVYHGLFEVLECQYQTDLFAQKGDSGSPVYAQATGGLTNVNLKGLLHQWDQDTGLGLFSSFHSVNSDFGNSLTSLPWGWPGGGGGGGGCGGDEGGPGDPNPC